MSSLKFIPQISIVQLLAIVAAAVVVWVLVRSLFGRSATIARRWPLTILRACILALLALLFLNPVLVTESPGKIERSEMFYLLDGSASMQMGSGSTRWKDSLNMIESADRAVSEAAGADIRLSRFGRRLSAIESPSQIGIELKSGRPLLATETTANGEDETDDAVANGEYEDELDEIKPEDSDSRLLEALRRISSRFGRKLPSGIVLFTDGRVRDSDDVLRLASSFRDLGVPIHVAPQGNLSGGGDVAIVGAVAPRRVRKYSEVDVNVFVRSFGYDGNTAQVELVGIDDAGIEKVLDSKPVTLTSGFTSMTLTFRSELRDMNLEVRIAPRPDEIATNNNVFATEIMVDRTKIRVLYVEGSPQGARSVLVNGVPQVRYGYSDLYDSLTADADIECVVLMASGSRLMRVNDTGSGVRGLPDTLAELAAFDAIILSNVSSDLMDQRELDWIHTWISKRGGGLMMVGGENSFASGGWQDTKIADILPVSMTSSNNDWNPTAEVKLATTAAQATHSIWHLMDDRQQRQATIQTLPEFIGANAGLSVKPATAMVLASASGIASPAPKPTGLSRLLNNVFAASEPTATPTSDAASKQDVAILTAGQYGKGRTLAMGVAIDATNAPGFKTGWGSTPGAHYGKFWRNVVYWLTESSSIGRRRLTLATDKRYYKPGDKLRLIARAFDEQSTETQDYRIEAMIEPHELPDDDSFEAPVRWPNSIPRESGEEGPLMIWGEVLPLPKSLSGTSGYELELELADALVSGSASQALRFEMVAYQDQTQVDSTSMDVQILHDPFEQQNPFPDHKLLLGIAKATGGSVLNSADDLVKVLDACPIQQGESEIRSQPAWSKAWLLFGILGLLTGEWLLRRHYGLA